jgi:hypothetical protein
MANAACIARSRQCTTHVEPTAPCASHEKTALMRRQAAPWTTACRLQSSRHTPCAGIWPGECRVGAGAQRAVFPVLLARWQATVASGHLLRSNGEDAPAFTEASSNGAPARERFKGAMDDACVNASAGNSAVVVNALHWYGRSCSSCGMRSTTRRLDARRHGSRHFFSTLTGKSRSRTAITVGMTLAALFWAQKFFPGHNQQESPHEQLHR